jgi:hypothetical protein
VDKTLPIVKNRTDGALSNPVMHTDPTNGLQKLIKTVLAYHEVGLELNISAQAPLQLSLHIKIQICGHIYLLVVVEGQHDSVLIHWVPLQSRRAEPITAKTAEKRVGWEYIIMWATTIATYKCDTAVFKLICF